MLIQILPMEEKTLTSIPADITGICIAFNDFNECSYRANWDLLTSHLDNILVRDEKLSDVYTSMVIHVCIESSREWSVLRMCCAAPCWPHFSYDENNRVQ